MITKVYDKIKLILKENWKFFVIFIILLLTFTYEFPYYIDAPGGIMDVSTKITMKETTTSEGSFNLAYVSELRGTIPTLLIATLNPNWDILKIEDVLYENQTPEEMLLRDQLLLQESLSNAVIVAYQKAGKPLNIESEKIYVGYKDKNSITTLQVGDQILSINGNKITSKEQLFESIESFSTNTVIEIEVLNQGKIFTRSATIREVEGRKMIGIVLTQINEIKMTPQVKFNFSKNESGPSGGFMTALSLYDMLLNEDLTKGRLIVGTGTISIDGSIGSIGGVKYKLKSAVKEGAEIFFVPAGENYKEALELQRKYHYDIQIVSVEHFDEAITYLKHLSEEAKID